METLPPTPTADQAQLAIIQKKLLLDSKIKNGVSWFYWIAGLSILNSVLNLFGTTYTFVTGLGITQIIDGFMLYFAQELGGKGWNVLLLISFIVDVAFAGLFVIFGILGSKRYYWVVIVGMVLYAIDGVILLLFQSYVSAGFHAWALFGIGVSLSAIKELNALEKSGETESLESIKERMPNAQPKVAPQNMRLRLVLIGLLLLFFVSCFVLNAISSN